MTVSQVEYSEYSRSFWENETLLYISSLADGERFALRTWIPDVLPTLQIRYTGASGEQTFLIFQSGKDGSLVLLDARPYTALPAEISGRLPFVYDLDGDGENETIDLVPDEEDEGRLSLTVDGFPVGSVFSVDGASMALWLADADGDGTAEIYFSGDLGSDDYVTSAWRGDTLEPISFTGECRRGADPSLVTSTADGRAAFSGWRMYLVSWSYQLGTYRAARDYELRDGVIAPTEGSDWSYDANRAELTVTKDLPVTTDSGEETVLPPGTSVRLLGTDGNNVRFSAGDGTSGVIRMEFRQGENPGWTIAGVREDEYFETLPYSG